jgi:hypothetical protein
MAILAFVVVVPAGVMVPVMAALVVPGRVVGAALGEGGSGATDGQGQGDRESRGRARDRLHICLLADEFRSWLMSPGAVWTRGYAGAPAEVHGVPANIVGW